METKKFIKNDSGFICVNCKKEVDPLGYTSRNHCPYCLYSLHVDNNPGDRKNTCRGVLKPVLSELGKKNKNLFTITFICEKCKIKTKNKSAGDDNKNLLIQLTNSDFNF